MGGGSQRARIGRASICLLMAALAIAPELFAALEPRAFGAIDLTPCPIPGTSHEMLCGEYKVVEDRSSGKGRSIVLRLGLLPAQRGKGRSDPIFFLAGGPGASAVASAAWLRDSWMNKKHNIVPLQDFAPIPQQGVGRAAENVMPGSSHATDRFSYLNELAPGSGRLGGVAGG